MSKNEHVQEFQRRRKKFFRLGTPGILLTLGGFAGIWFVDGVSCGDEQARLLGNLSFAGAVLGILWWILVTYLVYRCPSCNAVPKGRSGKRVLLDPPYCPTCGVRLK